MCHSAILVFESLNAAELRELCQFMRANRKVTLDTAIRALYEVLVVDGEDVIVPRELPFPMPIALPFPMPIALPFPMPIALPDDDEVLPF